MLVILLILFTNVLCDSDEDKYVDLLPDAEKQQFIEKVARRILEDVESKENEGQKSGELSDEQLRKHNEYVKAILKEESENIRRSKGEGTKVRAEEKEGKESEETLGVKPLENEKIADDPDLEQVDLTLRNDRREINVLDNSTEFIKVEIISEEPPIIKRSVRNESFSSESESNEATTQASELHETASELHETTSDGPETSTAHSELVEPTTKVSNATFRSHSSEDINPKTETEKLAEPKLNGSNVELEHVDKKQNELIAVDNKVKNKVDSTETDGEDIQVKIKTRRSETNESTNLTVINIGTEDFGSKLHENASKENHITTEVEESTTEPPDTTTDMTSTTQDIDAATVLSTATVFNLPGDNKKNDSSVEMLSENTLISTLSDEGTTDSEIDTTTSKIDTETSTTDYYIQTRTEYLTDSPDSAVATTERMKIIVEDFTSAPKTEKIVKNLTTSTEKTTKSEKKLKVTLKIEKLSEESEETTTKKPTDKVSIKKNKVPIKKATSKEFTTVKPKPTTKTKVTNKLNSNFKQIKNDGAETPDKNFIELEKVYYNKIKTKGTKEYEVYEIRKYF